MFPHRVRSDGLIANRIRATRKAYCLQLFQDEVMRIASSTTGTIRIVEAGPHIGDCQLWAAAQFGSRVRGLAVSRVGPRMTTECLNCSLSPRHLQALVLTHSLDIALISGLLAQPPWITLNLEIVIKLA